MGMIHVDLFTTLDGVAQAPGGPQEDTDGGFRFGGWQAPFADDLVGEQIGAGMEGMDALLLGRKTYDIFAAYWPHQEQGIDNEIARLFNRIPKYVASRRALDLEWAGSTQLGSDLGTSVREVRDRHEHTHVIGSLDLVQSLLAERLFDRLTMWVYPIVLGGGKRVFQDGAVPSTLTLVQPATSSPMGVVQLQYELGDATPGTGDMSTRDA